MSKILINGLSAKVGGGKSILNNLLQLLLKYNNENNIFYVLTPNKQEYLKYESEYIKIIDINSIYKKNAVFLYTFSIILPNLIKRLNVDIIFNLADIPIPMKGIKQVFLFDWSYAVYPKSKVWKMMDFQSYLIRRVKLFYFTKYIKFVTKMIAQTDAMKKGLKNIYNIKNIEVVPNAVSLNNMDGGKYQNFNLPNGIKLLYLTHYYPHKNLEIFIPLAKKIKKQNLDFKIIITIEKEQDKNAEKLLNNIKKENLDDTIVNIGSVQMENVPSLYQQCNGLLMPTLLESFSGTYVEAMYHRIPIFTSNFDFAKSVCSDVAFYFDPFDENDILKSLKSAFQDYNKIDEKINTGFQIVQGMDNWEDTTKKYLKIIEKELKNDQNKS